MKNIKFIVFVLILLIVPSILADESISQTSFFINIYNNTIQITSSEYSGNNQFLNFSVYADNSTNVTRYYVPYTSFNYSFLFVRNISVDMNLVDKYTSCLNDTNICQLNAASNFTQYSVDKTNKDNNIANLNTQITTLTKQQTDTQNQKWLYLFAGGGLAVLIVLVAQGKLVRKVKNKSDTFNRTSAT